MDPVKFVSLWKIFFCFWSPTVYSVIDFAILANVTAINANGPYLGIVVPNQFEMDPLFDSGNFASNADFPTIDISGRRFYVGEIESGKVIVVMSGMGMLNAGITTQLLLTYFSISGVLHHGTAGNVNDELNIGDVTIPQYWAHTGLWYWQKFGEGADDELDFEEDGDYTRAIGDLSIGKYNDPPGNRSNYLNNIWYQPEEVFPVTGTPEVREHHFWVPVDETFLEIATQVGGKGLDLEYCVNETTCLNTQPQVITVARGISSDIFLANAAYREFLHEKFDVSPSDMESAAVALTCLTNNVSFIAFRALSDNAGSSNSTNQASVFSNLAATNAVIVLTEFVKLSATAAGNALNSWPYHHRRSEA